MSTGQRVWLCWAQSLDGALAQDPLGRAPTNLTHDSPAAERLVHELRALADAIVVGIGTVLADDPRLNVRLDTPPNHKKQQPDVVILDPTLRCAPTARVFTACAPDARTVWLVTTTGSLRQMPGIHARAALLQRIPGVRICVQHTRQRRVHVPRLIQALADTQQLRALHVEGGAHTLAEWAPYSNAQVTLVAPMLMGPHALRIPWDRTATTRHWRHTQWHTLDASIICLVRYV